MNAMRITDGSKKIPHIYVTYFNGDYENYYLEMCVNGMFVAVSTCPVPGCHCMAIGCEEKDRKVIHQLEPYIRAYAEHFLKN